VRVKSERKNSATEIVTDSVRIRDKTKRRTEIERDEVMRILLFSTISISAIIWIIITKKIPT
jgi:hypothetical protein